MGAGGEAGGEQWTEDSGQWTAQEKSGEEKIEDEDEVSCVPSVPCFSERSGGTTTRGEAGMAIMPGRSDQGGACEIVSLCAI